METTQTQPRKLIVMLKEASKSSQVCILYFVSDTGHKWSKMVRKNSVGLHILSHLGVGSFEDIDKGLGCKVQIVLDDRGEVRFINAVDQRTGKVLFKPQTSPVAKEEVFPDYVALKAEKEMNEKFETAISQRPSLALIQTIAYLFETLTPKEKDQIIVLLAKTKAGAQ
jgi:hypothetical protein